MVRRWAAVGVVDGDMMDVKSRNKGIVSVENITCNILKICLCFHLLSGFQGVKRGGRLTAIALLLQFTHQVGVDGSRALHYAAHYGHSELVRFLVQVA